MKVDFKKTLDCYRATPGAFRVVDVPPLRYLMIDGHGDPNTAPQYAAAIAALYPLAYRLKFHIGPYDAEAEVLARMHDDFIPNSGLRMTGKHHEIYLSDSRRVEPSKLRTILRQPVTS